MASLRERVVLVYEPSGDPCEWLLAEWHARYEMVNAYHRALRLVAPLDDDAPQWQQERWRELNGKLATALVALRRASDQLQRCMQEHSGEHPV